MEKITVIIPTYCTTERNGLHRLRLSLTGYLRQSLPNFQYKIILIDDGSEWMISEEVKKWNLDIPIRVIRQEHKGMCSAINRGLSEVKSKYVTLSIDDNIPAPEFLKIHLELLEKHDKNTVIYGREYHMRQMKNIINPEYSLNGESSNESHSFSELILNDFNKILGYSSITEKYLNIEYLLENQILLKAISIPWLIMRIGTQSMNSEFLKQINNIDTNFDPSGWYMDMDLGYRLFKANAKFILSKDGYMVHISHKRTNFDYQDEKVNHKYFYEKLKTFDVALLPLYFECSKGLSIQTFCKYFDRMKELCSMKVS